LWDEPHPPCWCPIRSRRLNVLIKAILTCSICCAWAWSSSHFNSSFFFILSKAFFSFRFCLACELLKIQMFIVWWFCCLGPPTQVEGRLDLPTSMRSSCLLSKCWRSSHLGT
jgi:hypothetical protein